MANPVKDRRTLAWIGDAVLALFARKWILEEETIKEADRSDVFRDLTSNHFLSAFGDPTKMEAEIGLIYEEEGLDAAFTFIKTKFLPLFIKQHKKKQRPGSYRKRR